MTTLPTAITPMIAKLVPRLASNHAGEVVATAAAIGRILAANKLDWHDLTAAICRAPSIQPRDDAADEDWHDLLAYCAMHTIRLNGREREFLSTLTRWRGTPTERQLAWLEIIAAKLRGGSC